MTIAQFVLGVPLLREGVETGGQHPHQRDQHTSGTSVRLMARMMRPGSGRRENCQADASTKAM